MNAVLTSPEAIAYLLFLTTIVRLNRIDSKRKKK